MLISKNRFHKLNKPLIAALLISNAATGFFLWEAKQEVAALTSKATTPSERTLYGEPCVKWHRKESEKTTGEEIEFYLGRSWKKHGQFVFEIVFPSDYDRDKVEHVLCTYDKQSHMMYSYSGPKAAPWMFYD